MAAAGAVRAGSYRRQGPPSRLTPVPGAARRRTARRARRRRSSSSRAVRRRSAARGGRPERSTRVWRQRRGETSGTSNRWSRVGRRPSSGRTPAGALHNADSATSPRGQCTDEPPPRKEAVAAPAVRRDSRQRAVRCRGRLCGTPADYALSRCGAAGCAVSRATVRGPGRLRTVAPRRRGCLSRRLSVSPPAQDGAGVGGAVGGGGVIGGVGETVGDGVGSGGALGGNETTGVELVTGEGDGPDET
jgi:hypothetical protein